MTETAEKAQFTAQQIEDFCELNEKMPCPKLFDSNTVICAVQIIRQLQIELRAVRHIAEALAKDLPDDKRITLNRFRVQELVDILQMR